MNNLVANFRGFDGRLNRQPFWLSAIVLAVISLVISLLILPLLGLSMMPSLPALDGSANTADVMAALDAARVRGGWVSLVVFLVFLYPSAALLIKRRHDRNGSGIDVWIYFALIVVLQLLTALGVGMTTVDVGGTAMPVPGMPVVALSFIVGIFGLYLLVVLGFLKGTAGTNNYGPDPLQG